MRISSVGCISIAMIMSVALAGCVGYGHLMFAKGLGGVGHSNSDTGMLGATNVKVDGQAGVFVISDVAGKDFYKEIVVKGSPEDKGNGIPVDLWNPVAGVSGSVLGFRVNQAMKVTVSSRDFSPRVLVLESLGSAPTDARQPYFEAASSEIVSSAGGNNVAVATYRKPKDKKRDGAPTFGTAVAISSTDGRSGSYTISVEYVN